MKPDEIIAALLHTIAQAESNLGVAILPDHLHAEAMKLTATEPAVMED